MCFYFGLKDPIVKIEKRFERPFLQPELYSPDDKFNAFSHPINAIITSDNSNYITFGKWGLIPKWAKDNSFAKNTLIARIESIETLPSFKDNVSNRCLVLANHFYEWRHEGKIKQPHIIYSQENEIFCIAGIYSDWFDTSTNQTIRTYSIITTEANEQMKYIHNTKMRMPVILNQKDEVNWLNNQNVNDFAFPYESNLLSFHIK